MQDRPNIDKVLAQFDSGGATHVGKVRQRNEDSFLVRPEAGIWTVADGMGGHAAGDLASSTVVDALKSIESPASAAELLALCEDRMIEANAQLLEVSRARGGVMLGATVAVLLIFDADYACVWSGDSRIYRVRDGEIAQLSRDHTEVEELIAEGLLRREEARNWPRRNVITRAIGVREAPELEMISGELKPGDAFVICSDGLTGHVADAEILDCVGRSYSQAACDELVALTLARGATDNVTVVVVRYQPAERASMPALAPSPTVRE
jgi:protein phosphatase